MPSGGAMNSTGLCVPELCAPSLSRISHRRLAARLSESLAKYPVVVDTTRSSPSPIGVEPPGVIALMRFCAADIPLTPGMAVISRMSYVAGLSESGAGEPGDAEPAALLGQVRQHVEELVGGRGQLAPARQRLGGRSAAERVPGHAARAVEQQNHFQGLRGHGQVDPLVVAAAGLRGGVGRVGGQVEGGGGRTVRQRRFSRRGEAELQRGGAGQAGSSTAAAR